MRLPKSGASDLIPFPSSAPCRAAVSGAGVLRRWRVHALRLGRRLWIAGCALLDGRSTGGQHRPARFAQQHGQPRLLVSRCVRGLGPTAPDPWSLLPDAIDAGPDRRAAHTGLDGDHPENCIRLAVFVWQTCFSFSGYEAGWQGLLPGAAVTNPVVHGPDPATLGWCWGLLVMRRWPERGCIAAAPRWRNNPIEKSRWVSRLGNQRTDRRPDASRRSPAARSISRPLEQMLEPVLAGFLIVAITGPGCRTVFNIPGGS